MCASLGWEQEADFASLMVGIHLAQFVCICVSKSARVCVGVCFFPPLACAYLREDLTNNQSFIVNSCPVHSLICECSREKKKVILETELETIESICYQH